MACFLIDYENESGKALEGISLLSLTKKDEVLLFYSKNADRITMELHKELEGIPAKKKYIEIETGTPNALDFQLSSYLGACIREDPKRKYYIITQDGGYDCVCRFWKERNIFVKRLERICRYAKQTP